eukprot:6195906-Pleurochrysis_carterae.AAC.1
MQLILSLPSPVSRFRAAPPNELGICTAQPILDLDSQLGAIVECLRPRQRLACPQNSTEIYLSDH